MIRGGGGRGGGDGLNCRLRHGQGSTPRVPGGNMPRAHEYQSYVDRGMCAEGCGTKLPLGHPWRRCQECLDDRARRARRTRSARRPRNGRSGGSPRTLPRRQRVAIAKRDGWRCHYCGADLKQEGEWHIDHLVPVSRGGSNEPTNLAAACVLDNLRKGDMTETEYCAWLADYGAKMPTLSQDMWAAVGAVRAVVKECATERGDHAPCDSCRSLAIHALADIHARGLFRDCRSLVAIGAPAPTFDDCGRSNGCRTCSVVSQTIWNMLRLSGAVAGS